MLTDLADLVLPRWCAGCGQWDCVLCDRCARSFGPWRRADIQARYLTLVDPRGGRDISAFPVYSLAIYGGVVSKAIVTWKNRNDSALDAAMAGLLPPVDGLFPALSGPPSVLPAPSSTNRVRNGRFVAGVLATRVAEMIGGRYQPVLTQPKRWFAPAHGGNAKERRRKRTQRAKRRLAGDVILVDDVLTTGATLAGSWHAVRAAGGRVVGGIVLASTRDPRTNVVADSDLARL